MFLKRFVKDPRYCSIFFDCGSYPLANGTVYHTDMVMVFSRMDPRNPSRCIFVEQHARTPDLDYQSHQYGISPGKYAVYEALKYVEWYMHMIYYEGLGEDQRKVAERCGRRELTPHVIRIKTMVNDTELPDLSFDIDKREISFNWQDMLDQFFREQEAIQRMISESWTKCIEPIFAMDVAGCPIHTTGKLIEVVKPFQERDREMRRVIRRRRITQWYRDHGIEHSWPDEHAETMEESLRLSRIEDRRVTASRMYFDD